MIGRDASRDFENVNGRRVQRKIILKWILEEACDDVASDHLAVEYEPVAGSGEHGMKLRVLQNTSNFLSKRTTISFSTCHPFDTIVKMIKSSYFVTSTQKLFNNAIYLE